MGEEGFEGRESLQVDRLKRGREKRVKMLMQKGTREAGGDAHACSVVGETSIDIKNRVALLPRRMSFATKTDVDTEHQLVHKRVHTMIFMVSIYLLLIARAGYICPLLLEQARPIVPAVTDRRIPVNECALTRGARCMA